MDARKQLRWLDVLRVFFGTNCLSSVAEAGDLGDPLPVSWILWCLGRRRWVIVKSVRWTIKKSSPFECDETHKCVQWLDELGLTGADRPERNDQFIKFRNASFLWWNFKLGVGRSTICCQGQTMMIFKLNSWLWASRKSSGHLVFHPKCNRMIPIMAMYQCLYASTNMYHKYTDIPTCI